MGACIGKKSTKYLKRDPPKSDISQTLQPKTQDDTIKSSSLSQKLPVTDGCSDNDDDEFRISKIDELSITSELRIFIDEQKAIGETLCRAFPTSVISTTDTEFENELATLMSKLPEDDETESQVVTNTITRNGTR